MNKAEDYIKRLNTASMKFMQQLEPEIKKSLAEHGLTQNQLFILFFIYKQKQCKVSDLSQQLEVKPSAVTTMIDRLVHHGLISREQDHNDRRIVLLELTDEGIKKVLEMKEARMKILAEHFSKLTTEELKIFTELQEKLIN